MTGGHGEPADAAKGGAVMAEEARIAADGHVHITNRVYWAGIDLWQPQPFGFDDARAVAGGVNVVIENIAPPPA